MYNIIPLILILISISAIIVIVVRKFSILASLDIDNIPAEKEARFKEQIISNRFKRNLGEWHVKIFGLLKKTGEKTTPILKKAYNNLLDMKEGYKKEKTKIEEDDETILESLWADFENDDNQDNIKNLEDILIKIIGIDSKNIKAFKELGNLYLSEKKHEEARQTFKHVLKLIESSEDQTGLAEIYFNLALINKAMDSFDNALVKIKKAVEIEPNNPRYLDTMLEISIINKDKELAKEIFGRLKEVNPENKKLEELKKQIDEL